MTWTFASTDLSTALSQVRLLIGDTDTNDQQLTDEEIAFYTSNMAGTYYAAASAAEALAASYARRVDKSVGSASISASQRQDHYLNLSARLRSQAAVFSGVTPYAGGISDADKRTFEVDTDRVEPAFIRGWGDYPGTGIHRGSSS